VTQGAEPYQKLIMDYGLWILDVKRMKKTFKKSQAVSIENLKSNIILNHPAQQLGVEPHLKVIVKNL